MNHLGVLYGTSDYKYEEYFGRNLDVTCLNQGSKTYTLSENGTFKTVSLTKEECDSVMNSLLVISTESGKIRRKEISASQKTQYDLDKDGRYDIEISYGGSCSLTVLPSVSTEKITLVMNQAEKRNRYYAFCKYYSTLVFNLDDRYHLRLCSERGQRQG